MNWFIYLSVIALSLLICKSSSVSTDIDDTVIEADCANGTCFNKCCKSGQILFTKDMKTSECVDEKEIRKITEFPLCMSYSFNKLKVNVCSRIDENACVPSETKTGSDVYKKGIEKIDLVRSIDSVHLLENGSLHYELGGSWLTVPNSEFCLDYLVRFDCKVKTVTGINRHDADRILPEEFLETAYKGVCMIISSFFLLLVLVVYLSLPERHNMPGMMLMAFVTTLALTYVITGGGLYLAGIYGYIDMEACKIISPIFLFSWFASFMWMKVMSFDIWWTVKGVRLSVQIHRWGLVLKFLSYALYVYGTALFLTVIAILIDQYSSLHWSKKPGFEKCMAEYLPRLYYFHIPIAIIIIFNLVLFILTAYNIWVVKNQVNLSSESRSTKKSENRLKMYLKMSALMGVNWILEIIGLCIADAYKVPVAASMAIDTCNLLIGVAIFVLFVCNTETLIKLDSRYNLRISYIEKLRSSKYSATTSKTECSKSLSANKSQKNGSRKKTVSEDIPRSLSYPDKKSNDSSCILELK